MLQKKDIGQCSIRMHEAPLEGMKVQGQNQSPGQDAVQKALHRGADGDRPPVRGVRPVIILRD